MMHRPRRSLPFLIVLLAACGPALKPLPPLGPVPAPPEERPAVESAPAPSAALRLMVPVEGVDPARISDSFNAPRDGSRVHRAVDILAPRGTPVLAADSGVVLRLGSNKLGGILICARCSTGCVNLQPVTEIRMEANSRPEANFLFFFINIKSDLKGRRECPAAKTGFEGA